MGLPCAQDPEICECLAVHLHHSGLGALKCGGSMFLTSVKGADDILCSKGSPGCSCSFSKAVRSCFILTNPSAETAQGDTPDFLKFV